jgi:hypothetical protein
MACGCWASPRRRKACRRRRDCEGVQAIRTGRAVLTCTTTWKSSPPSTFLLRRDDAVGAMLLLAFDARHSQPDLGPSWPERLVQRNGDRDRDGKTRSGTVQLRMRKLQPKEARETIGAILAQEDLMAKPLSCRSQGGNTICIKLNSAKPQGRASFMDRALGVCYVSQLSCEAARWQVASGNVLCRAISDHPRGKPLAYPRAPLRAE